MPSDASIYDNVGRPAVALLNPLDIQAKRNALALQDQSLQGGAYTLQQQQLQLGGQQALNNYMASTYGTPPAGGAPPAAAGVPPQAAPPSAPPALDPVTGAPLPPPPQAPPMATAPAAGAPPSAPAAAVVPPRPPVPTMQQLLAHNVPYNVAAPMIEQFQKIDETSSSIDKSRAEALKANNEANDLIRQQQSDMVDMLSKTATPGKPLNQDLINWHLQHFASLGPQQAAQAQQVAQHLSQLNPEDQLTFINSLRTAKTVEANAAADTAQSKLLTSNRELTDDADKRGLAMLGSTMNPGTKKGDPKQYATVLNALGPDFLKRNPGLDTAANATADSAAKAQQVGLTSQEQVTTGAQAGRDAEIARHNRADEFNATQNREAVALTPAARDQMATFFATTGQLPNLGMGAAVAKTRSDIINRAAQMFPNVTFASNAANFQANKASLKNVQGTLDTLSAFENAGLKNLKMFTDAAAKMPDTGIPWLNTPVRLLDEKLVGSTNMSVVNAARQIGLREIARVTNDPKLSGVLSDSARQEVQNFSPTNATLPQIIAVSKTLQTDMANVHSSLAEQRDAINSRINPNAGATPASGTVSVTDPKGGVHTFANQAAAEDFKTKAGIK